MTTSWVETASHRHRNAVHAHAHINTCTLLHTKQWAIITPTLCTLSPLVKSPMEKYIIYLMNKSTTHLRVNFSHAPFLWRPAHLFKNRTYQARHPSAVRQNTDVVLVCFPAWVTVWHGALLFETMALAVPVRQSYVLCLAYPSLRLGSGSASPNNYF